MANDVRPLRVVILAQKTIYADVLIQALCDLSGVEVAGLVYSDALLTGKSKIGSVRTVIQKGGMGVFVGKLLDVALAGSRLGRQPYPVHHTANINSEGSVQVVRDLKPDVIFSIYFNQILKRKVLDIPQRGAVNLHPSYLPEYRGIGPTFWVLANNEKETGVSYHFMTPGIDDGDIISQRRVSILKDDSIHSLYLRCSQVAAGMLPSVVSTLCASTGHSHGAKRIFALPLTEQDEAQATYFGLPDKQGYRNLRRNGHRFITTRDILASFRMRKFGGCFAQKVPDSSC